MSENQTCFEGYGVSLKEKIEHSITLLKTFEDNAKSLSPDGYFLAFSGGKDSVVIKELAKMAGVKHKCFYSQTTIDPPELIRFIKQHHADVEWRRPKRNFFKAVSDKGLPSRKARWCCEEFKEDGGDGMVKILGVRAAESVRRKKAWKEVTLWRNAKGGFVVAPILNWSDEDVWQFIREFKIQYCGLYDEGFKRLGCIGCPIGGANRMHEFKRWPGFEKAWRKAANSYFDIRKGKISRTGREYYIDRFKTGDEFFEWWMSENPSSKDDDQMCLNYED